MPSVNPNVEILKPLYAKWHETKGGSVEDWMAILADEIDFRSLAMGQLEGGRFTAPRSSREAVRGYFEELLGEWKMVHFTVDEFIADGGRVCMIGSTAWTHKTSGKTVETPKVDVWRFENGKAVAFFEYYDTAGLVACATC